jgi:transcriptional regulator
MTDPFATFTSADVKALIVHYPLAWVCSTGDTPMEAAQLPLIGEYEDDGRLRALIGHLGRRNPLCDRLRRSGTATVLFSGPAAYVSPEHAGRRDWAPTWNHANLRITVDVTVDAGLTDEALDTLIQAMEVGRDTPWTRDAIMHRYAGMAQAIIGFRATVTDIVGRFKLGQDEGEAVYRNILDRHPDAEVTEWMRRFNPSR